MSEPRKWIEQPGTVLVAHTRYQLRGGEDIGFETEVDAMRSLGWRVETVESSNFEVEKSSQLTIARQAIWNSDWGQKIRQKVDEVKPDVFHVHNFFPMMSPAVHWAAHGKGVGVVQTLHNYRLGCLNGMYMREGRICMDCFGKLPVKGVVKKCYRNSRAGSAVVLGMVGFHRMVKTWQTQVDVFICHTESTRRLHVGAGVPTEKLMTKPTVLHPDPGFSPGGGDYCMFAGRFSPEKGITSLLKAWQLAPDLPNLILAGGGPLEPEIREIAAHDPRIKLTGHLQKPEVTELMRNAKALIFPSEWYEPFGLVILEAIACGTPVVSSEIGAPRDILGEGPHAEYFEMGVPDEIAAATRRILDESVPMPIRRQSARARFVSDFSTIANMTRLAEIYDRARHSHSAAA